MVFNERIAFIIIHWTNRADNIERIAGILASKPITACQCQFTNVGFPACPRIMITLFSWRMALIVIPVETLSINENGVDFN